MLDGIVEDRGGGIYSSNEFLSKLLWSIFEKISRENISREMTMRNPKVVQCCRQFVIENDELDARLYSWRMRRAKTTTE